jgi:hypothetical protein
MKPPYSVFTMIPSSIIHHPSSIPVAFPVSLATAPAQYSIHQSILVVAFVAFVPFGKA